jgi:hypothetical protein
MRLRVPPPPFTDPFRCIVDDVFGTFNEFAFTFGDPGEPGDAAVPSALSSPEMRSSRSLCKLQKCATALSNTDHNTSF